MIRASHRCHQTYLRAAWKGGQLLHKAQPLTVICFAIVLPLLLRFCNLPSRDTFTIIKLGLRQQ